MTRLVLLGALALALAPSRARADGDANSVAARDAQMWFAEKQGELSLTVSFTDVFDRKRYDSLSRGFPVVVQVRTYVYRVGGTQPVALRALRFRVIYDLWDEVYLVQRIDGRGVQKRTFRRRSDALRAVTQLNDYPVASLSDVPVGPRHFAGVVVELNPVSPETQAQMRQWLTRRAGESTIDGASSLFGSLVSVFVNPRSKSADRVVHLRSQPFFRETPKK